MINSVNKVDESWWSISSNFLEFLVSLFFCKCFRSQDVPAHESEQWVAFSRLCWFFDSHELSVSIMMF